MDTEGSQDEGLGEIAMVVLLEVRESWEACPWACRGVVVSEGRPQTPSLSRTTRAPSSCFGHRSIFKATLMKTAHGKCTEQSLNSKGMHGSLYLHCTITKVQGSFLATGNCHFFNLLIMKIFRQAQCHALHIF